MFHIRRSDQRDASQHFCLSASAKVSSLVAAASVLQLVFILMGIVSQLMRGYTVIEVDVYLIDFFVSRFPGYIVFASLFVFIQTLVKNRYIGYFASVLFFFAMGILVDSIFEWSSNMILPGSIPGIFYSDMSGFGPGMEGSHWFNLYWLLFALILLILSALFWPRSSVGSFKEKMKVARANFKGGFRTFTIATFALWIAAGGWVFYNTQILNRISYLSKADSEQNTMDYELEYKKYENASLHQK